MDFFSLFTFEGGEKINKRQTCAPPLHTPRRTRTVYLSYCQNKPNPKLQVVSEGAKHIQYIQHMQHIQSTHIIQGTHNTYSTYTHDTCTSHSAHAVHPAYTSHTSHIPGSMRNTCITNNTHTSASPTTHISHAAHTYIITIPVSYTHLTLPTKA